MLPRIGAARLPPLLHDVFCLFVICLSPLLDVAANYFISELYDDMLILILSDFTLSLNLAYSIYDEEVVMGCMTAEDPSYEFKSDSLGSAIVTASLKSIEISSVVYFEVLTQVWPRLGYWAIPVSVVITLIYMGVFAVVLCLLFKADLKMNATRETSNQTMYVCGVLWAGFSLLAL